MLLESLLAVTQKP